MDSNEPMFSPGDQKVFAPHSDMSADSRRANMVYLVLLIGATILGVFALLNAVWEIGIFLTFTGGLLSACIIWAEISVRQMQRRMSKKPPNDPSAFHEPESPISENKIIAPNACLLLLSRIGLFLFFSFIGLVSNLADGRHWHIFATVIGIVYVLFVILPPIRVAGRFISPLLTAPIVLLASILTVELLLPPRCSSSSVAEDAAPIIRQLDEYHRIHGHYPPTLEAAGIIPPQFRCGTFTYTPEPDSSSYALYIGDYSLDNFCASWDSKSQEWFTDS